MILRLVTVGVVYVFGDVTSGVTLFIIYVISGVQIYYLILSLLTLKDTKYEQMSRCFQSEEYES